jgi:molybdopterin molybdotransferase
VLELETALQKILDAVPKPDAQSVCLLDAAERFLAGDVSGKSNVPPFDNSAMDGYAVISGDVANAADESPKELKVIGRVAAGEVFSGKVLSGTCVRLFTGSPMPTGADAIVMQEDVAVSETDASRIIFRERIKPWENVRFAGEDVKSGAVIAKAGDQLNAGRLALLIAGGCRDVTVARCPIIGLLATGSELKESGEALGHGQIYESNRTMLSSLVAKAGGRPRIYQIVRDDLTDTRDALRKAFAESDIVITSGGVSVGEMDFVKQAFEEIGGSLEFWRIAVKPGRPFVFGRLHGKLFCGLPGNPVSALVTFLLLVRPAILKWQGASELALPSHPARLAETISNDASRRSFMRVNVASDGRASLSGIQASHILSSVANANALLELPPKTTFHKNDIVSVLRFG